MKTYFLKLKTPRPDFIQTITPTEVAMMQAHAAYWKDLMGKGIALAFGPVMAPSESFGLGIMRLEDGVDPAPYVAGDPAIKANVGMSYEIGVMPMGVILK